MGHNKKQEREVVSFIGKEELEKVRATVVVWPLGAMPPKTMHTEAYCTPGSLTAVAEHGQIEQKQNLALAWLINDHHRG